MKATSTDARACASTVGVGELAASAAGSYDSIEVNPLLVLARGQGVLALDAYVSPARPDAESCGAP